MPDHLLAIGEFARLSGLTVHALRHYDDVRLLIPAEVDDASGYRRYSRHQLTDARLIRSLRWLDLPIEDIRRVLEGGEGATADVMARHGDRLERQLGLLQAQLREVHHIIEEGIAMAGPQAGCTPVQLKIAVNDVAASVAFYSRAFAREYEVTRRTDEADYSSFMFGRYGEPGFFLLHLLDDPGDVDRPGQSTFGLLVEDLDAVYRAALNAGAIEAVKPHDPGGMPRCSAVKDPDHNWIWLYQAS